MKTKNEKEINNSKFIKDVKTLILNDVIKNNIDIANALNYSASKISEYLNEKVQASKPFLDKFYENYAAHLVPQPSSEEELNNTATIKALYIQLAKLKSIVEKKSIDKCFDDIDDETTIARRQLLPNLD